MRCGRQPLLPPASLPRPAGAAGNLPARGAIGTCAAAARFACRGAARGGRGGREGWEGGKRRGTRMPSRAAATVGGRGRLGGAVDADARRNAVARAEVGVVEAILSNLLVVAHKHARRASAPATSAVCRPASSPLAHWAVPCRTTRRRRPLAPILGTLSAARRLPRRCRQARRRRCGHPGLPRHQAAPAPCGQVHKNRVRMAVGYCAGRRLRAICPPTIGRLGHCAIIAGGSPGTGSSTRIPGRLRRR